ncbi:Ribonuclease Z [Vibrio aerogenes CECT 7868]|uniref:Ribonuclease Z n=1 Tax=Vibrio aerogenes CECT 7868 TaxID=1216006 RepID=A0A1M5XXL2_9VIBR|nr:ribonuclease Z [Vibrio aerogenes]SHI03983.1 Ribonuclease Z [Vibrio aerogenes CECT 7868]
MDILFLGTSAGVPTRKRNVTAIAVSENQSRNWCLVDCGEGTQQQLLRTHLSLHNLQAIFITHIHGDHCYGLIGLLASAGMSGRKTPLRIVAPQGIREWIEATKRHTQLFIPYELHFTEVESLTAINVGPFEVHTTELSHRVPSYAYRFTEKIIRTSLDTDKLKLQGIQPGPVWGKLRQGQDITHEGQQLLSQDFVQQEVQVRKIVVCGDNDHPQLLQSLCQDCDVLVHEATYTQDIAAKASDAGHSYAGLIATFAESMQLPNLILTHFSPRYQSDPEAPCSVEHIRREAYALYSGNLYLAEDFDHYQLMQHGEIKKN